MLTDSECVRVATPLVLTESECVRVATLQILEQIHLSGEISWQIF